MPDKPLLLLLPGLGGDLSGFADLAAEPLLAKFGMAYVGFPAATRFGDRLPNLDDFAEQVLGLCSTLAMPVILIGHSLGGLVALLALARGARAAAFISIEGNLASEDCGYVSRKCAAVEFETFRAQTLPEIVQEFSKSHRLGDRHYANGLHAFDERLFHSLCPQIVELSDSGYLLDEFVEIGVPAMHIRGEDAGTPSYIARLQASGIQTVAVPDAGHFPFLDNSGFVAKTIAEFLDDHGLGAH